MGAGTSVAKGEIKGNLTELLEVLDERSRAILWHLWWHRHAEIAELRDVIDAGDDFEVLFRLKEVINQQAQRLWGRPVASFEKSRIDPLSGDKVLFSWWFLDKENIPVSDGNKPLIDVFNEKNDVTVIAQLTTPVDPARADILLKNGILKVRLRKHREK
jgi:HSP20 family molecular chaperone IbpA